MHAPAQAHPTSPAGWRARWRARWIFRARRPKPRLHLHHRNVYIMPTGWGGGMGLMLLVLLLAAINYQSNMGHLLTFLVTASAVSGMFQTHASLRGLSITCPALPVAFVNESVDIPFLIHNPGTQYRPALAVYWADERQAPTWLACPGQSQQRLALALRPTSRGWQALPLVRIASIYPMGLFRAWALWQPEQALLVCPSPEVQAPHWPKSTSGQANALGGPTVYHEDSEELRPYREGDPLKWVLWKKAAKSTPWFRRDPSAPATAKLWLRAQDTGLSSPDARLRRLTAWVLRAHRQGLRYGLEVDARTRVAPHTGEEHLLECLTALALWEPTP